LIVGVGVAVRVGDEVGLGVAGNDVADEDGVTLGVGVL